jgi:hypothetical protein
MMALLLAACLQAPTLDAEAGFQGTVFPDAWTRVSAVVTYEGTPLDAELRITLPGGFSEPVVYRRPLRLIRKARMRLGYDVYLTDRNYGAEVEIVAGDKVLQKATLSFKVLTASIPRFLTVGNPPDVVVDGMARKPPVTMVRLQMDLLPSTSLSLACIDRILIAEPIPLDGGQEAALREWVRGGGTLIFGAGRSTLLRQNAFWRELCPLASPEITSIPVPTKSGDLPLTLVRGELRRGRSSFPVGGTPVVLRAREGAGEVVFLPILLEQSNLGRILPAADLVAEILDLPPPPKEELVPGRRGFITRTPEWTSGNRRTLIPTEMTDLLRKALPPEFSPRFGPLALAIVAMIGYIILIGPVEYLRLRRRGRLRTGWRSFGLLVLVFGTLTALWSALNSTRESRLALVSLLDQDRIRTYGVFRPAVGGTYDLEAPGPISPLAPGRPFGAVDTPDPISVALPSEVRLPTPTSATRLLAASRPVGEGDGALSAEWATPERKSLKVRHAGPFPLVECWAVSKESVWRLQGIAPDSTVTVELTKPIPFNEWAAMLGMYPHPGPWRLRNHSWTRMGAARFGLVLSFYEALHAWNRTARYQLFERGVDFSPELEQGAVFLVGSFDRNLSAIRCTTGVPATTFGWARTRIREGDR